MTLVAALLDDSVLLLGGQHPTVPPSEHEQHHERGEVEGDLDERVHDLVTGTEIIDLDDEGALGREGADVQFVEHPALELPPRPPDIRPFVVRRIDGAQFEALYEGTLAPSITRATNIAPVVRSHLRGDSVAHTTYRLDDVWPELLTDTSDGDLDHVGAGIEPHTPHVGEQLLSADRLA